MLQLLLLLLLQPPVRHYSVLNFSSHRGLGFVSERPLTYKVKALKACVLIQIAALLLEL